jgi:hypothetical protein
VWINAVLIEDILDRWTELPDRVNKSRDRQMATDRDRQPLTETEIVVTESERD